MNFTPPLSDIESGLPAAAGHAVLASSQGHCMPGYLDLKSLADYSSCSVRWLRDRLIDSTAPLPFYRIGGKILVARADFDAWMNGFRIIQQTTATKTLVDDVMADLFSREAR